MERASYAFDRFLDDYFEAYPVAGSDAGHHAVDDRWPDLSEVGRAARIELLERHREQIGGDAEGVDRGIALEVIDRLLFEETELREGAWNAMSALELAGTALFLAVTGGHAPWEQRAPKLAARLRGLPQLLEAAAENLVGLPGRPVSRLHVDTALEQLPGITELIDGAVALGSAEVEAAAPSAHAAVERFRIELEGPIRDRSEGEGRLGAELYAKQLRHTLASELSAQEVLERAWREYDRVHAQIRRIAHELDGGEGSDEEVIARVWDQIAAVHHRPEELLDYCRAEVARLEAFCRERDLLALPDEPLEIEWTPVFLRAYGGAFLYPPGPLDKGLTSRFFVTPPDESKGAQAIESFLREENDRALRLLCIHEAVPGHYVQFAYANRCRSLARTVFYSGVFAEGWALYCTQAMMDAGYGADDPALLLTHWRMYLRAVVNAIIDVEIHTGSMTEEQALDLMKRGAFQEDHEARAKWLRARLTSTQLSTYFVGYQELSALAGETGASWEQLISHGAPPIRWLRELLAA